nr:hypothetical protein GTC16762_33560 [Pigmentibacter ruber]
MTSYMTKEGLNIKRQPQILSEMIKYIESKAKVKIALEDSLIGNYLESVSFQLSEVWEGLQSVYDSSNPDSAEEKNLDDCGLNSNIIRLEAAKTKVEAALTGKIGTKIPKDFLLKCVANNEIFCSDNEIILKVNSCIEFSAKINETVIPNKEYFINISGSKVSYTSKQSDKAIDVCRNLVSLFNIDNYKIIQSENYYTISSNDFSVFLPFISENQTIDKVTNKTMFSAKNDGAIICPAETLNVIISPVLGLSRVTNNEQARSLGRLRESDIEYRARRSGASAIIGQNVWQALKAKLADVRGVSSADVINNDTDKISSEGLPPHSYQAIVEGGDDQEIAAVIYNNKPSGIPCVGSVKVPHYIPKTDQFIDIYFSRPSGVPILVKVELILTNNFPENGDIIVREAIAKYGNSLGINNSIIDQRFYGAIFASCSGIVNINLLLAKKSDGIYKKEIKISRTEYATFSLSEIMVLKNVQ